MLLNGVAFRPVFALVLAFAAGLPAAVPKAYLELVRPAAEHIPEAELQQAMALAVRAGVLRLIERASEPQNEGGLIYPPHAAWRSTGTKTVEQRYRIEKRNLYEEKEVEQLMPVRDEYGTITGYAPKKVKVRVSDKVVGTIDVEVPDEQGPLTRQITVATGDRSRQMLPRGWYGMNGQGLYLLCRVGLGRSATVGRMATELERLLAAHGMPDTTWDIAWLAMGFMAAAEADAKHAPRATTLVNRLLDGVLTEGDRRSPARGLWGPVCINHEMLARFFQLRLDLDKLLAEAENVPENASKAQRAAKQKEYVQISQALGELARVLRDVAQQGRRLADIEKNFSLNEDIITAGLSHYIYNRMIVDLDSTAVAALALEEAGRRKLLPAETPRPTLLGRQVLKNGIRSREALQEAWRAVLGLAGKEGNYDTGAQLVPIRAYEGVANLLEVPLTTPLPPLLRPETWRSNLSAAAALRALSGALGRPPARGSESDAVAKVGQRAAEAVQAWLAADPNAKGFRWPHAGETDALADLEKNKGWPQPAPPVKKPLPVAELSPGYLASPRELLEPLLVLHRDGADAAAARQIAYRLIIEQRATGEWAALGQRSGPLGVSSGEWAYLIGKLARYHLWQAKSDREQSAKDPVTEPFRRDGPFTFRHKGGLGRFGLIANVVVWDQGGPPTDSRWPSGQPMSVNLDAGESLAALLYLAAQLKEPVAIEEAAIAEIAARAEAAKKAHEQALLDLQQSEPDEAARLKKANELQQDGPRLDPAPKFDGTAKHPLWNAILAALGSTKRIAAPAPPKAVDPAPPAEAPPVPPAEAPPAPPAETPPGKTLDDLLPKTP